MSKFKWLLPALWWMIGAIVVLLIFRDNGEFGTSPLGLPEAKIAEVVKLKDGDSYNLRSHYVVKEIGNRRIRMIGYNGSIPGPFIQVEQGSTITINFTNETEIPSTIHSHGLRLDYRNDGTPGLSQQEVKPGAGFTYTLTFPDSGSFWYHPHVREDYAQELGQYGTYNVLPNESIAPVNQEVPLIVDDLLMENEAISKFYKDKTNFALMGRFGNVMLVNGSVKPSFSYPQGSVIRYAITNVANARPFDLSIPGAKIKLVGSDLSNFARQKFIESIIIGPAERYLIDVYYPKAGEYYLLHTSHDQSMGEQEYIMASINISEGELVDDYKTEFEVIRIDESVKNEANRLIEEFQFAKPDKELSLDLDISDLNFDELTMQMSCHKMSDGSWMGDCTEEAKQKYLESGSSPESSMGSEKIHWEDHIFDLNKSLFTDKIKWQIRDTKTDKVNEEIDDWTFDPGQFIKIRIKNNPLTAHPMQHPFHMHGQRMMVISINGVKVENAVWKDTILIQTGDSVDIVAEMSNPGLWMAHCHIAEHLTGGMMFNFRVGEGMEKIDTKSMHDL